MTTRGKKKKERVVEKRNTKNKGSRATDRIYISSTTACRHLAATYSSQASVYTARSWTYQEERKNCMNAQSVNPVSVRRNSPAGLVLANGSPTGSAARAGRMESQKILAMRLGCAHTHNTVHVIG